MGVLILYSIFESYRRRRYAKDFYLEHGYYPYWSTDRYSEGKSNSWFNFGGEGFGGGSSGGSGASGSW